MLDARQTRSKVMMPAGTAFGWIPPDPRARVVGLAVHEQAHFIANKITVIAHVRRDGDPLEYRVEAELDRRLAVSDEAICDALDAAYREMIG